MRAQALKSSAGFTYLAAIILVVFLGIMLGATGQGWKTIMQRDKEEELIFRGRQIRDGIARWQKKYPGKPLMELKPLLEDPNSLEKARYLRKIYKDPITNKDFALIMAGGSPAGGTPGGTSTVSGLPAGTTSGTTTGGATTIGTSLSGTTSVGATSGTTTPGNLQGIIGVASSSNDTPIKKANFPDDIIDFAEKTRYSEWQFNAKSQAFQNFLAGIRPGAGGPIKTNTGTNSQTKQAP